MSVFSFEEQKLKKKGNEVFGVFADYVVLDTETTGLDAINGNIIEMGIVKVENFTVVERYQSFINPHLELSPFITSLTGITDDMLADAPNIQEVLPEILKFVGDNIVVAHNAGFDIGFLTSTCQKQLGEPFLNDYLDTLRMSRRLFPEMAHHKLGD